VSRLAYLGVLAFVLVGSTWLEIALRTRVLARWRRLLLSLVPVVVVFALWDSYAVAAGHWTFDPARTTGIRLGTLPLEEVLFFVVVPFAAILTLEAVRAVKGWEVGDEPPGACVDGVRVDASKDPPHGVEDLVDRTGGAEPTARRGSAAEPSAGAPEGPSDTGVGA
jgi:lycopene cyclase domain-containing protein